MLIFGQVILGLLLLFVGGELLVRAAVFFAERLKMSKLLIGITIVAYGTSSPELLITIKALMIGSTDIAFGNVVGSNIANILLVLGLAAAVYPIQMERKLVRFDMLFLVMATALLIVFISDHVIKFYEAAFFCVSLVIYTFLTFRLSNSSREHDVLADQVQEIEEQGLMNLNLFTASVLFVVGIAALMFGADLLVKGASLLAKSYGVSEATIAVTIVAVGGSAPELVTSFISALRKHSDIAIGNVVGSNIFNILGVLGITGMMKPFAVSGTLVLFDIWVVFIVTLLLFMISLFKRSLSRAKGALFLCFYALYVLWQILV